MVNEILIQSQLGEGHFNIVNAHEVLLTSSHLCLMLEFAAGGTLTDYVSNRYSTVSERGGLFLDEHEARYLFQVRLPPSSAYPTVPTRPAQMPQL